MLLKCALFLFVLNFASISSIADAGAAIATTAPIIPPVLTPAAIPLPTSIPAPIVTPGPVVMPSIAYPSSASTVPSPTFAPITTFLPSTPPTITYQPQSTTIQPLAAAYQLAAVQQATTTQATTTQVVTIQAVDSLTIELQKANDELNIKHQAEYDHIIKESLELAKEKETVLIQLQAQLKLQLEAQQFASQQRERAIREMQEKLVQEEQQAKKEAENMKLNVQSLVDLSPLVLNLNQPPITTTAAAKITEAFNFSDLKTAQDGAASCKHGKHESECKIRSTHCKWGKTSKNKKEKCLFMCEKLSKEHCKKVSGCFFKDHKCRNK